MLGEDIAEIRPLGSGCEVGRSCIILTYKGRNIMFDCGVHPAKVGFDSLPLFDLVDLSTIDIVLITHFHTDHCGALPYLCSQDKFRGRIFMTRTTKEFFVHTMEDLLRGADEIVTRQNVIDTYAKIETIEYHQEIFLEKLGIRVQAFNAGHVLGAAMFSVDIAGMRTLYTGDYSREEDRHLPGAEIPSVCPDILIVESTHGRREHETRFEREEKFTRWVREIVTRGGRCLIPMFALGRAQELLLILEDYWHMHPELQNVKVYYASAKAEKCMGLYRTHISSMNEVVQKKHAQNINPFDLKYVLPLQSSPQAFDDSEPCVVLAGPGMLQPGIALDFFEKWCGNPRNGIIFAGYCVDGTLATEVIKVKDQIPADVVNPVDHKVLKIRMRTVETVSFSAHSDARQTKEFISHLHKTKHCILVHGNQGACTALQEKLSEDFKDREMTFYTPNTINGDVVRIPFLSHKKAKILGSLAANGEPQHGDLVNGVLLTSDQHHYTIVDPKDIPVYTGLEVSSVQQAIILPFTSFVKDSDILAHLRTYFSQSEMFDEVNDGLSTTVSEGERSRIVIAKDVFVDAERNEQAHTIITITWATSRYNDLVADVTCIALMQLLNSSALDKNEQSTLPMEVAASDRIFRMKCFHHMMSQFYTSVKTDIVSGTSQITLENDEIVTVTDCIEIELPPTLNGKSIINSEIIQRLKLNLKRAYLTIFALPAESSWCECGLVHHGDEHRSLKYK